MNPLPDWAIASYAEGSGSEADLAKMVLALQQEIRDRQTHDELLKVKLFGLARVVREKRRKG